MFKSKLNEALSNTDLKKHGLTFIQYKDLKKTSYEKLLHLMPIGLLYPVNEHSNHWSLIHMLDNGSIEFYDSYSLKPDQVFEFISPEYKLDKELTKFLFKISLNHEVHYNEFQHQEYAKDINTCGKHILMRNYFPMLKAEQYNNVLKSLCKKYKVNPDELVCMF